jgi:hypothetical protein
MKAQRASRLTALLFFLNSTLYGGWVVKARPGRFFPGKEKE